MSVDVLAARRFWRLVVLGVCLQASSGAAQSACPWEGAAAALRGASGGAASEGGALSKPPDPLCQALGSPDGQVWLAGRFAEPSASQWSSILELPVGLYVQLEDLRTRADVDVPGRCASVDDSIWNALLAELRPERCPAAERAFDGSPAAVATLDAACPRSFERDCRLCAQLLPQTEGSAGGVLAKELLGFLWERWQARGPERGAGACVTVTMRKLAQRSEDHALHLPLLREALSDPELRGQRHRLLLLLAETYLRLGEPRLAQASLDEARVVDLNPHEVALAHQLEGEGALMRGEAGQAAGHFGAALAGIGGGDLLAGYAQPVRLPGITRARLLALAARAEVLAGLVDRGLRHFAELLRASPEGDGHVLPLAHAAIAIGDALRDADDRRARRLLGRALVEIERLPPPDAVTSEAERRRQIASLLPRTQAWSALMASAASREWEAGRARRALQHWAEAFECLDGALSYLGGQRAGIGRNELSRILAESRAGEEGLYRAALQAPQERDLVRLAAAISMQMTGRSLREGAEVGVLGSDLSPSALQGWEQASSGRCGLPAGSGSRPDLPAASAQACLGEQAEVAIDLQRVGSGVDGRYLAFVLSRGRHFQIVDLGSAERLETRAQILLRALRHPWRAYGGAARRVSSMLRPLHEYLRGDVLLCVQGALGLLPFEILPIGARLVSDQASLHYVTSLGGGDPGGRQGGSWDPSKVGAPLFLGDPQLPTSTDRRPGDRRAIRSDGTLPPLPGARAEARAAARAFPESALHLGRDATEGALMSAGSHGGVSPRLIHLAAHGLYAPLPGLAADSPAEPFLRLAPSPGQDGVLRAEEIATELDLAHTELVILSACNSGNGEARAGQGIAGLQHAFLRAGANRVLMTRWSVDDGVSRELMADFVRRLGRQADEGLVHPELALREAARRIRRRRPHPYFWAPFLLLDGSNQR